MDDLPDIEIVMTRSNLADLPHYDLPDDFQFHWYAPGDETAWTDIHLIADRHNDITPTLFRDQFGDDAAVLYERQCYLQDAAGKLVGTASAWFPDAHHDASFGRVHWVAILPEFQGKGLAKPLLAVVMQRLKELGYQRAHLDTSAARLPAIGLYLKFGFLPEIITREDDRIWKQVLDRLKKTGR
jgi:GNAT superfamily N-acetyltransferase